MRSSQTALTLCCAVATALSFVGGMVVGVAMGNVVSSVLPGHVSDPVRTAASAVVAVACLLVGSAVWGGWMGRIANNEETRRMAWAGVLGLGPITLAFGAGLVVLEPIAVAGGGGQVPVHRVFTLLFVPAALLIAAAGSLALGFGLRDRALAWRLAWRVGVASAVAFLIVDLVLEAVGWRVGGPGAAERYTMVIVTFAGAVGAALAGGSVLGVTLARASRAVASGNLPRGS